MVAMTYILTAEQDAASVTPAAFVRYLPAEQRMHTTADVPEYCPAGHYLQECNIFVT